MKKYVLFLTVILIAFLMLSFFKKQPNVVNIKFSTWGSQNELLIIKPLIDEFEAQNPKIKIELVHIPQNYFQKLHLLFASNSAPDVIFINNLYLPFFANAGVLEPLEKPVDIYEEKALLALSFKNKLYAIPRDISTVVIFRNKDLFKKCSVKLPDDSWDEKEFLQTALSLSRCKNNGKKVYGVSFEEHPPLFYLPYLMSNGGGILSDDTTQNIFNSKESVEGLKFYSDLRNRYHVAPLASESANLTMAQMFLQKSLGMHLSGHWIIPKYLQEAKFEWDTITFPKGKLGSIVSLDASGYAISKSSKHKQEAYKFIEFMTSKQSSEKFTAGNLIIPAREDVLEGLFLNSSDKNINSINKAFLQSVKTAKVTPVSTDYNKLTDDVKQKTNILFNE